MEQYLDKNNEYFMDKRSEMLKFVPSSTKKILEIGCGSGLFGKECKQIFSCEFHGIELMEEMAQLARENLDMVLTGDVTDNLRHLLGNKYDLIVLNDVIEHLADSEGILIKLKELLDDNGKILLSVPNFRFIHNMIEIIFKKDFRYKESGTLDKTHLSFYTKKSFSDTVVRLGFKILKFEGINETESIKMNLFKPFVKALGHADVFYCQYAFLISRL